jgi:hypothetical protein
MGGGSVALNNSNTFGSLTGVSGAAVNGGTVVRDGTVLIGNGTALGGTTIELGDKTPALLTVKYATKGASVLGTERTIGFTSDNTNGLGGVFVGNANGLLNGDGSAQAGAGAFYNVSATIDGNTFTAADATAGTRILVKDEIANPERNGIYRIVYFNTDGTVNLVRANDFDKVKSDPAANMLYGTQVKVTDGSSSNQIFFVASADVAVASGVVRYYIIQKNKDISMEFFKARVKLSELTISRIVSEIENILDLT